MPQIFISGHQCFIHTFEQIESDICLLELMGIGRLKGCVHSILNRHTTLHFLFKITLCFFLSFFLHYYYYYYKNLMQNFTKCVFSCLELLLLHQ